MRLMKRAGWWMSAKAGAGTVPDWCGGRYVLNGGFGTLSPAKRLRGIRDSTDAMGGELSRERMESHNSYLVHVNDLLALDKGTLRGIQVPLKVPGSWSEAPPMTPNAIAAHASVIHQMKSKAGAPFICAVFDADAPTGGDHMFKEEETVVRSGSSLTRRPLFPSCARKKEEEE